VEEALAALDDFAEVLGSAIGSLANLFDPELVVVGGGFGEAVEPILSRAQEAARREALTPADASLRVVSAELGTDAGLVGAGLVGFEALDGAR
jgi:glucokinase